MARVALRSDEAGYLLDDEPVAGFPDQPALPLHQRRRIALWAQRFASEKLSEEQRRLLRGARPAKTPSRRTVELTRNRAELAELNASGLLDALTPEERSWVTNPSAHPQLDTDVRYPLTVGQLELVTGATGRQLRHWIDQGLVSGVREGRNRRVYSTGLAEALLLARLEQPEKTMVARVIEGRAALFLHLLSHALRVWSNRLPLTKAREVQAASEGLSRVARLMGDGPNPNARGPSREAKSLEARLQRVAKQARGLVLQPLDSSRRAWIVHMEGSLVPIAVKGSKSSAADIARSISQLTSKDVESDPRPLAEQILSEASGVQIRELLTAEEGEVGEFLGAPSARGVRDRS